MVWHMLGKQLIHIIDDDVGVCNVLADIVRLHGFEVMTFFSPSNYLEYMGCSEHREPSAIFSDMNMPGMDGVSMLKQVQPICSAIPGYIVTADPSQISDDASLEGVVHRVLTKPVRIKQMTAILNAL